ncbi:PLAC8-domain-containing protein [Rhizopogon salebrosus TDB-379]|nr:PLAC8-domain-containing protein [Rhizopogon salebrosus TDB-379]
MQPTIQMNVSELPRNEAKPGEQIERNQEKGEGQPEKQPHTHNDWRYDLFSCWDDTGTCCMSCWCPCLIYGQNRRRLDHLEENDMPHPEHGGSGMGPDCIMHVALNTCCALGWALQLGERGRLRLRYRIAGNSINDCLTAFFCTPCELTQESRELEAEEMATPNAERQDVA